MTSYRAALLAFSDRTSLKFNSCTSVHLPDAPAWWCLSKKTCELLFKNFYCHICSLCKAPISISFECGTSHLRTYDLHLNLFVKIVLYTLPFRRERDFSAQKPDWNSAHIHWDVFRYVVHCVLVFLLDALSVFKENKLRQRRNKDFLERKFICSAKHKCKASKLHIVTAHLHDPKMSISLNES